MGQSQSNDTHRQSNGTQRQSNDSPDSFDATADTAAAKSLAYWNAKAAVARGYRDAANDLYKKRSTCYAEAQEGL